ncbi:MAG: ABC transporter ATP-binding protein [Ottowia sp.]|uniref:ABC transporter ATP-binding protein n=1 Tax=unclassified Ottowia TaxID=2645081 RepID=UPI003C2C3E7C
MARTKVELSGVSQQFSRGGTDVFTALEEVTLRIEAGKFVSLIGPSGCGKSTIFNIVAGLQQPTHGEVIINGRQSTGMVGAVGYMLQKDLLFPWRTVIENIVLGMEVRGVGTRQARDYALPFLEKYGLGGFADAYPQSLSGGMRQRAALLRTLLFDSDVILLDEPFGALDAQTRSNMQEWLLQIWHDFQKTVIFVTHDVEEAVYLSDEIYVMAARPGRVISHINVPLERPRPRSVAMSREFREMKAECLSLLGHFESTEHETASAH